MTDQNTLANFERSVQKTYKYAWWLYYLGIVLVVSALGTGVFKVMQKNAVAEMKTISKGNNRSNNKLEEEFQAVYDQYQEDEENGSIFDKIGNNQDDKRAVLMGQRQPVQSVLNMQLMVCILFFI